MPQFQMNHLTVMSKFINISIMKDAIISLYIPDANEVVTKL